MRRTLRDTAPPETGYRRDLALKILGACSQPMTLLERECRVTASVGISLHGIDASDEQSRLLTGRAVAAEERERELRAEIDAVHSSRLWALGRSYTRVRRVGGKLVRR